jgi:hypothetical protein
MLDWDMILGEGDHKAVLTEMYAKEPLELLSERLGVAKLSLRAKIVKEGIPMRPQGGVDPVTKLGKSRLDALDKEVFKQLTPQEIAKQFDMHPSAVYKYAHKHGIEYRRTRESIPRQGDNVQADEVQGDSSVGERDVEAGQRQEGPVRKEDVFETIDKPQRLCGEDD